MVRRVTSAALVAVLLAGVIAPEAAAHHPMGGTTPTTFWHGLLSGFGHPIIGLDHFAAVIAAGCIAATQRNALALALTYGLVMLGGAALHAMGVTVPGAELLAALAVIVLGAVLAWPRTVAFPAALGLFALAGVIHGYVLGEAIVGAEPGPLVAYFIGLAVIQVAIMAGIVWLARTVLNVTEFSLRPLPLRAAGVAALALGLWFLAQNAMGVA